MCCFHVCACIYGRTSIYAWAYTDMLLYVCVHIQKVRIYESASTCTCVYKKNAYMEVLPYMNMHICRRAYICIVLSDMCICAYVPLCICIYTCAYGSTLVYAQCYRYCAHIWKHFRICVHMYMHVHIQKCFRICAKVQKCFHICIVLLYLCAYMKYVLFSYMCAYIEVLLYMRMHMQK